MQPCQQLQALGQSLWLDNITRDLLDQGVLRGYIELHAVTGLTSNPTIFDEAIKNSSAYDQAIQGKAQPGISDEALFMELALEDLSRAAELFKPIYEATHGVDGWVSMEVSPLLANDATSTIREAQSIYQQAACANLFIKIPGTPAGIEAIEEVIFLGVPVNVTLLFSVEQYYAAAEAYLRGIERRAQAGLNLQVESVASVFISRWDKAVSHLAPQELQNRLGIAIAGQTYRVYRELLALPRWQKLVAAGAHPQRLLWASTGTKDPKAAETLYVEALAAPDTVNTMPEKTLLAFTDQGQLQGVMKDDGGNAAEVLSQFKQLGVDRFALAEQLQKEGAEAFVKSWQQLMERIRIKREQLLGV